MKKSNKMETHQTKVSGDSTEELSRSTAGEKEFPESNIAKQSSVNIMQDFLMRFVQEFREEITDLKNNLLEVKDHLRYIESKLDKVEDVTAAFVGITTEERRNQAEKTKERKDVRPEETVAQDITVDKYINTTDFSLPLFDESNINPVFHLNQLDTYINLRNVPNAYKLTIAFRSLNGVMSKQWAETMVNQFKDYEQFKREFLKVW
jgi:hypothetical protein